MLFGASALSPKNVWVVGDQEGTNGKFETLVEHWDGTAWSVVPSPDPGAAGNHLYAIDAVSPSNVWAVGQELTGQVPDLGLVEDWNGVKWSVVRSPLSSSKSVMLTGVAVSGGQVWTVGEADSPTISGGMPLIEHEQGRVWLGPGTRFLCPRTKTGPTCGASPSTARRSTPSGARGRHDRQQRSSIREWATPAASTPAPTPARAATSLAVSLSSEATSGRWACTTTGTRRTRISKRTDQPVGQVGKAFRPTQS